MSSGRGWTFVSLLSGVIAVLLFAAIFMASGGRVAVVSPATPMPTPGQPVDTPFIYARPAPLRAAAPASGATASPTSPPPGGTGSSASENNAAPDVSVPPNPFTAGIHT